MILPHFWHVIAPLFQENYLVWRMEISFGYLKIKLNILDKIYNMYSFIKKESASSLFVCKYLMSLESKIY